MIYGVGKIGLVASAVSICISLYILNTPQLPRNYRVQASSMQNAMTAMQIDREALAAIKKIEPHLSELRKPLPRNKQPIELALLGYKKIEPLTPEPEPIPEPEPAVVVAPPAPDPFDYNVSMTYVSGDRQFAVIDGRFYRIGAILPKGERVLAITPSAVRIERSDRTEWVGIRRQEQSIGSNNEVNGDSSAADQPARNVNQLISAEVHREV